MAPADIICSVVWAGKTRARAASSAVPSRPTNQPSAISTVLWAATFRTLGAASVRMVGTSGPASIASRRSSGLMAGGAPHAPVQARRVVEKASSREKATMPVATQA